MNKKTRPGVMDSPDRSRHASKKAVFGAAGSMLAAAAKPKRSARGAAKSTTSKVVKHKKTMY